MTLHKYLYCFNNPGNLADPSGNSLLLDTVSSMSNRAGMASNAYDAGSTVLNMARQIAAGASLQNLMLTVGAEVAFNLASDKGLEFLTGKVTKLVGRLGSAKELRKMTRGSGLEVHHLVEKRFADTLDIAHGDMLSIVLTKEEHQLFTNGWRKAIGYGSATLGADKKRIVEAARDVYRNSPGILQALGL